MKEKTKQILNKKWDIPGSEVFKKILQSFSVSEKIFFYILAVIMVISGLVLLKETNNKFLVGVPAAGGFLKEGIIGSPRFVNPVLAVSDVDRDLSSLIYSGLMKESEDNKIIPDLAESYQISSDKLEYTFTLKDNITFHDGEKITVEDVEFTIKKIQDNAIKSPKRANFYDIKVEKLDDQQIKFTLKNPYAPFLNNLTVGILPKHIWNNLDTDQFPLSQYNVEPIGSGPYKITKMQTLQKNMLLVPTYYELSPFKNYALGAPFIEKLIINFYSNEKSLVEAYIKGDIEAINSISPNNMTEIKKKENADIKIIPLPRIFAVFFNQNESEALAQKEVRQALNMSVDRQKIINEVLGGYGDPLYGPIPKGLISDNEKGNEIDMDFEGASSTLAKAGWKINTKTGILEKVVSKNKTIELVFSISTLNSPDLVKAAEIVKQDWEKLGAKVTVKQFDSGDFRQDIIRTRKFEALLFGEAVGRDTDFYAFWHSSQRNDPGINISMYTNSKVDGLLDEARKTSDLETRIENYQAFEKEIMKDIPAVFLYSPNFIYVMPDKIKGDNIDFVTLPYERFLNVGNWYIETNKVWEFFKPSTQI